jgi:hypothetical protein
MFENDTPIKSTARIIELIKLLSESPSPVAYKYLLKIKEAADKRYYKLSDEKSR